ncbi:hypothetical protein AGR1C_Lc120026 [Agrobacterium fabacearum TT111]|nr:hypothetical protein AGR1C_Lc120026 [Agrobacterium fabacearum TT111]
MRMKECRAQKPLFIKRVIKKQSHYFSSPVRFSAVMVSRTTETTSMQSSSLTAMPLHPLLAVLYDGFDRTL